MLTQISRRLHARSAMVLNSLEQRLHAIFAGWTMFVLLACATRLAIGPVPLAEAISTSLPTYALLIMAPLASALLALRWWKDGEELPGPTHRLARIGRWREVSLAQARRHPLFGTSGIMVSLLVGMLLNVPFRVGEFLLSIPPLTAATPGWVHVLQMAMAADAVLLSSLYVIAFVAALRRVACFPRLLATVWLLDIAMQLVIAHLLGAQPDLPPAAAAALSTLLYAAVTKVLISVTIWLPYLLLSRRVNVTYRRRILA